MRRGVGIILLFILLVVPFASAGFFSDSFIKIKSLVTGEVPYSPPVCIDTDSGSNIYVKGSVIFGDVENEDFCTNNFLTEFYCSPEGFPSSDYYQCTYGCYGGKCLTETVSNTDNSNSNLLDKTKRIAYYWGKVNQHTEEGVWKTDTDGKSGANIDKLTYCKKWYSNSVSVREYSNETIEFKAAGNTGSFISTRTSYECVQGNAEPIIENCSNECSVAGQNICSGNYSARCGNYDDDSCLEYGSKYFCAYGCLNGICLDKPKEIVNETVTVNESFECKSDLDCREIVCPQGGFVHEVCEGGKCVLKEICQGINQTKNNGTIDKNDSIINQSPNQKSTYNKMILANGYLVPLINEKTPGMNPPDYLLSDEIRMSHIVLDDWKTYSPMQDKVKELTFGINDDYKKASKILDWVRKSKLYCDDSLEGTTDIGCVSITNEMRGPGNENKYDYADLFNYEYGVCLDASIIALSMLRSAGISSNVMYVGSHIVTLFYSDGFWYGADPTFYSEKMNEYTNEIINFSLEDRAFYYHSEGSFSEHEAAYFDSLPVIYLFDYISDNFSNIYIPNKEIMVRNDANQYICSFLVNLMCDSYGCFDWRDKTEWTSLYNVVYYDVNQFDPSGYAIPFAGGYNHYKVPSEARYKFECSFNDGGIESDVAILEFIPKTGESFVLKPEDLVKSPEATEEEYKELLYLLQKDLYLNEVFSVLDGSYSGGEIVNLNDTLQNIEFNDNNVSINCDSGCLSEGKCYAFGYVKDGQFCSEEFGFRGQSSVGSSCENSFECSSNICIEGTCISANTWQKFLNWFKKFI